MAKRRAKTKSVAENKPVERMTCIARGWMGRLIGGLVSLVVFVGLASTQIPGPTVEGTIVMGIIMVLGLVVTTIFWVQVSHLTLDEAGFTKGYLFGIIRSRRKWNDLDTLSFDESALSFRLHGKGRLDLFVEYSLFDRWEWSDMCDRLTEQARKSGMTIRRDDKRIEELLQWGGMVFNGLNAWILIWNVIVVAVFAYYKFH